MNLRRRPLSEEEERQLCDLFNRCSMEQQTKFMAKYGLFHASFLNPAFQMPDDETLQERVENSKRLEETELEPYIHKVWDNLKQEQYYVVIPFKNNRLEYNWVGDNDLYIGTDICGSSVKLLLGADNAHYNRRLFQEKLQKHYCVTDIYDLCSSAALMLLPKMMEDLRLTMHGMPSEPHLTPKRWDIILRELVWFLDECVNQCPTGDILWDKYYDDDKEQYEKERKRYVHRLERGGRLLGKYFINLVD